MCCKLRVPDRKLPAVGLSELDLFQHSIALRGQMIEPPQHSEHGRGELRAAEIHEGTPFFGSRADQLPVIRRENHTLEFRKETAAALHGHAVQQDLFLLCVAALHVNLNFLRSAAVFKFQSEVHCGRFQPDEISLLRAAEAPASRTGPDCFQQIGLALRVVPENEIQRRMRRQ